MTKTKVLCYIPLREKKNRHSRECMQVKSLTKERQGKICLLLNISSLIIKSEVPLFILIKEIKVALTSVATEVRSGL